MSHFRAYLQKQDPPRVTGHLPVQHSGGTLFVTIPCFDEPDLITALDALAACTPPSSPVTVVVVVNSSDQSPPDVLARNLQTIESVQQWWNMGHAPFFRLRLLHAPSLPSKWAGVGWARKIAMDEAISCLEQGGEKEGILISFDADSTVSENYFISIEAAFRQNPRYQFVNINFCHPVDGQLDHSLREGIILYELYLRYLRNAMQWCGYPHAIHTVGSSFAVRATAYVKQGGMNRRQAGEDFHFLHKMVLLGDYGKITEATVFPSARISHRVPFGTGAALKKWQEGDPELNTAYSLCSFRNLRSLLSDPGYFFMANQDEWRNRLELFDPFLQNHLLQTGTMNKLKELKKNCANLKSFTKRFYHQINAFWLIQYLNSSEKKEDGKGTLVEEASKLLSEMKMETQLGISARELLEIYRKLDLT